jgi:hypothetical protein
MVKDLFFYQEYLMLDVLLVYKSIINLPDLKNLIIISFLMYMLDFVLFFFEHPHSQPWSVNAMVRID